ncbi:MAG: hypothetical protein RIQ60_1326 [Pseudomonadota bacterium]
MTMSGEFIPIAVDYGARSCFFAMKAPPALPAVRVYYGWRPNLPDEGDNHLIELAVAAAAEFVVTRNLRDVARGELKFPNLTICDPLTFLREIDSWQP